MEGEEEVLEQGHVEVGVMPVGPASAECLRMVPNQIGPAAKPPIDSPSHGANCAGEHRQAQIVDMAASQKY